MHPMVRLGVCRRARKRFSKKCCLGAPKGQKARLSLPKGKNHVRNPLRNVLLGHIVSSMDPNMVTANSPFGILIRTTRFKEKELKFYEFPAPALFLELAEDPTSKTLLEEKEITQSDSGEAGIQEARGDHPPYSSEQDPRGFA